MKNKDIFSMGKIIDKFIAVNPEDLDNEYTSCLIEYNKKVYEVIINKYNSVLDPDEEAIIVSESLSEIVNEPIIEDDKPLVTFTFDKTDSEDDSDYEFPNFIL